MGICLFHICLNVHQLVRLGLEATTYGNGTGDTPLFFLACNLRRDNHVECRKFHSQMPGLRNHLHSGICLNLAVNSGRDNGRKSKK
jgi:hypothetical protein